jgi:23S rRNA (pseudouridine1915-N3)-methyltransferase
MKIIVSLFGEPKDENILSLVEEYRKRTTRYQDLGFKYFKKYEGYEKFTEEISVPNRKIVILRELGKEYDTKDFAKYYEKKLESGVKELWFCIGPAEGWGDLTNANVNIDFMSLSRLTMQHDLAFLVLVEQVYRAVSIKNNLPYNK